MYACLTVTCHLHFWQKGGCVLLSCGILALPLYFAQVDVCFYLVVYWLYHCALHMWMCAFILWYIGMSSTEISPTRASLAAESAAEFPLNPVLNWANVCSPNILRTLRRTMIRFLIELLVRRIWFGQSKLYFILNWLVMRCKLRPELAADAQQTA